MADSAAKDTKLAGGALSAEDRQRGELETLHWIHGHLAPNLDAARGIGLAGLCTLPRWGRGGGVGYQPYIAQMLCVEFGRDKACSRQWRGGLVAIAQGMRCGTAIGLGTRTLHGL